MTPTKTILILTLIATAMTTASANAPGGAYVQCDARNAHRPLDARRMAGKKIADIGEAAHEGGAAC